MGVYLWTEAQERQPWANTVAYRPLTSDNLANDMSWNWNNLSYSTSITFGINAWVNCVNLPAWRSIYLYGDIVNLPIWTSARTISFWDYNNEIASSSNISYCFKYWNDTTNQSFSIRYNGASPIYEVFLYTNTVSSWVSVTTWIWKNHIVTYANWVVKYYINWELVWSANQVLNTTNYLFAIWADRNVTYATKSRNISNFIIENKERTATETSIYYNVTKSKYWL